jgi:hypothetical protein
LIPSDRGERHAAYLDCWLKVLKADKQAIFTDASLASRAADYLHGLQPADRMNSRRATLSVLTKIRCRFLGDFPEKTAYDGRQDEKAETKQGCPHA